MNGQFFPLSAVAKKCHLLKDIFCRNAPIMEVKDKARADMETNSEKIARRTTGVKRCKSISKF